MLDDAARNRIARCLDYHDTGSPTHEDVQALWRAYTEAQVRCYRVCGHVYPHEPVSQAQVAEGQCPTCKVREQLTAAEDEREQGAPVPPAERAAQIDADVRSGRWACAEGVEETIGWLLDHLAAAEAERDEQRKDAEAWYRQAQVLGAENDRLEPRAARLAAVETAARAWRRLRFREEGMDAAATLDETVAALDAPPGET